MNIKLILYMKDNNLKIKGKHKNFNKMFSLNFYNFIFNISHIHYMHKPCKIMYIMIYYIKIKK